MAFSTGLVSSSRRPSSRKRLSPWCRPIKPDPLARINLGLMVDRRMVAKLGDDHVRNGRFGRQPAGHDVLRCVRLHDRARAVATDVFRAARDQHPPLRRDHVEAFADVLADLRHGAATARTQRARRLDDPFQLRQMGRQAAAIAMRTLIRHAPRSALDHCLGSLLRRVQDALRDLHVFQRQVILIWPQLLGLRAELLASQFAENDLQPAPRFPTPPAPLMLAQGRLRLRQKRLQLFIFVAQRRDAHALFRARRRRACHVQNSFRVILPQLSSCLGTPCFFRADQPPSNPAPRTGLRTSPAICASRRLRSLAKRTCNLRDACAPTPGLFDPRPKF